MMNDMNNSANETNTVYALLENVDYEGSTLLGVFTDKTQAKAEAKAKQKNKLFDGFHYEVQALPLNTVVNNFS